MTTTDDILRQHQSLNLVILKGIWEGYLNYIPVSIRFVPCDGILLKVFQLSRGGFLVNGEVCLHKHDIQNGIHRKVVRTLGESCKACGGETKRRVQVHHIKQKRWGWGRSLGFTVLCQECHNFIHCSSPGLLYTKKKLKEYCGYITQPESPYFIPPAATPNESTILTRHRLPGAINYYSLDGF